MNLIDFNHPFFELLWRRLAVIAVCLGWAALEFYQASPFWGILFGTLGLYCIYGFFFIRKEKKHSE
ncbi:MAG: DUF3329 domain-containing protein [SAR324 cluster bacterium]|nr:DUF3329 domain-containing protein [SAR324 cluster bacterium]